MSTDCTEHRAHHDDPTHPQPSDDHPLTRVKISFDVAAIIIICQVILAITLIITAEGSTWMFIGAMTSLGIAAMVAVFAAAASLLRSTLTSVNRRLDRMERDSADRQAEQDAQLLKATGLMCDVLAEVRAVRQQLARRANEHTALSGQVSAVRGEIAVVEEQLTTLQAQTEGVAVKVAEAFLPHLATRRSG